MNIEAKNFVATVDDIRELTKENVNAMGIVRGTRTIYLRALIGTTQAELKGTKDITTEMQLKSLKIVHNRFYPVVLSEVTTADIADSPRLRPEEKTRRSLERNRRSNFARSDYSTLKAWLQSGARDLMSLKPGLVTKVQLIAETPAKEGSRRKVPPDKVRQRTEGLVDRILDTCRALAESNPTEALAVLDSAMQRIAQEMFQGAITPTTDATIARKEHRPLKAAGGVFWPTESQVIRRARLKAAA